MINVEFVEEITISPMIEKSIKLGVNNILREQQILIERGIMDKDGNLLISELPEDMKLGSNTEV